jgi:hypothetical protein
MNHKFQLSFKPVKKSCRVQSVESGMVQSQGCSKRARSVIVTIAGRNITGEEDFKELLRARAEPR